MVKTAYTLEEIIGKQRADTVRSAVQPKPGLVINKPPVAKKSVNWKKVGPAAGAAGAGVLLASLLMANRKKKKEPQAA